MAEARQIQSIHSDFQIKPVAGHIGAEIEGIKLTSDLNDSEIKWLHQTLLKHKVLFFRNQQHLDDEEHEAFSRLFGELYAHPTVPSRKNTKSIFELDSKHGGRADAWHTDLTFVDAYAKTSILRSVVIPEGGGDTVWADTAAAYSELPEGLRRFVDQLWAIHTNEYDYEAYHSSPSTEDRQFHTDTFTSTIYETEHPVVRVHPETGERTLVLGQFIKRILGLSLADSNHLFSILQDHVTKLENTVRWKWHAGDVVIWDNRATQHYAINDYGDKSRVVRRVTLAGEVPVSVDGRHSVTHKKVKVISGED